MRMTKAILNAKVDNVNRLLGFDPTTNLYAVEGAITLYGAYGGYGVHRYSGGRGGVSDLMGGCQTAREAARFLDGMREALYIAREVHV